eukprot:7387127-Prymnesium_polylepis.1
MLLKLHPTALIVRDWLVEDPSNATYGGDPDGPLMERGWQQVVAITCRQMPTECQRLLAAERLSH